MTLRENQRWANRFMITIITCTIYQHARGRLHFFNPKYCIFEVDLGPLRLISFLCIPVHPKTEIIGRVMLHINAKISEMLRLLMNGSTAYKRKLGGGVSEGKAWQDRLQLITAQSAPLICLDPASLSCPVMSRCPGSTQMHLCSF